MEMTATERAAIARKIAYRLWGSRFDLKSEDDIHNLVDSILKEAEPKPAK